MPNFKFVTPIICTNFVRTNIDIPDSLVPEFRKFLTTKKYLNQDDIDEFLASHDLETVQDKIDFSDVDTSDLYWEISDSTVMVENEKFEHYDNSRDWLLRALNVVRESGETNMYDRPVVARLMQLNDYDDESTTLLNMDSSEYFNLLNDLGAWLELPH